MELISYYCLEPRSVNLFILLLLETDGQFLSLYPPSPNFISFGAASVMMCYSASSSTPSRPSVYYPIIVQSVVNIRYQVHYNIFMTIWIDRKCSTILLLFWSLQKDEHLSMPRPEECRSSRTHVQPLQRIAGRHIWYFVLIEREALPRPDLIPATSRRPALLPTLTLSPLRPSPDASVPSRSW